MLNRERYQNRLELLQGTLDLLILQALQWGPQHGYGISQALRSHSADILQVDTGSLYPALYRLEHQGLITAEWGESDNKRKAKYYTVTAAGRRRLREETDGWKRLATAMAAALDTTPDEV